MKELRWMNEVSERMNEVSEWIEIVYYWIEVSEWMKCEWFDTSKRIEVSECIGESEWMNCEWFKVSELLNRRE